MEKTEYGYRLSSKLRKELGVSLRMIRAKRMMIKDDVDLNNYYEISVYLNEAGQYLKTKHGLK